MRGAITVGDPIVNFQMLLPLPRQALFRVAQELCASAALEQKLIEEIRTYWDIKVHHSDDERKEYSRYMSLIRLGGLKSTAYHNLMKGPLLKNYFAKRWLGAQLSDTEVSVRFLLRHNHDAQKIAETIFPAPSDEEGARKWESNVANVMDCALMAARALNMPSVAAVMGARKEIAQSRLAEPAFV